MDKVAFNIPYTCLESNQNINNLIQYPETINKDFFQINCKKWFEDAYPTYNCYLTSSATRALELVALFMNIQKGDEIIMTAYNFVGVANAFVNFGAKLVFVDINPVTMNIDERLIEKAITKKSRAIIAMHYTGFSNNIGVLKSICSKNNLLLIEDNAQGILSTYNNKLLGSFGDFSCISFDKMKNISCNEGGILLCQKKYAKKIDVLYNIGTNKTDFQKGKHKYYSWVSKGSKFSMSEFNAAILYPLLEQSSQITNQRKAIWNTLINQLLDNISNQNALPTYLLNQNHNAHIAFIKLKNSRDRNFIKEQLSKKNIESFSHYTPLNASNKIYDYISISEALPNTQIESNRLLRIPMHNFLNDNHIDKIVGTLKKYL